MINIKAGSKLAIVGTVDPQTVINSEKFTDVVDMGVFHQAIGIALLGDMSNETIDFRCATCDADGSNAVTLKGITQLAASATANDLKQAAISVRADELIASGKTHVKFGLVTSSTGGGPAAVLALGLDARQEPASDNNLATVLEVKL